MKLRNLLFGTMIACAFVACSNDDDPGVDNGGGNTEGKTMLRVSPNVLTTKAAVEDAANAFRVYVIDNTGAIVADGVAGSSFEVPATAEGQVEIVVLKNIPANFNGGTITKKSELLGTIAFSSIEESGSDDGNKTTCSLNTAFYKVSIERGKLNTLGYELADFDSDLRARVRILDENNTTPIPAYRNVAMFALDVIILNADKNKYPEATFTPKQVYVVNAKASSSLVANSYDIWAPTEDKSANVGFLGGFTPKEYGEYYDEAKKIDPENIYVKEKPTNYNQFVVDGWESDRMLFNGYARWLQDAGESVILPKEDTKNNPNHFSPSGSGFFWTYENTNENTPTLLIVKGDFSYKDAAGEGRVEYTDRFYTIVVGKTLTSSSIKDFSKFGFDSKEEFLKGVQYVRRNLSYAISLTVSGPGSINPFIPGDSETTKLQATVELVPFGEVRQDETID